MRRQSEAAAMRANEYHSIRQSIIYRTQSILESAYMRDANDGNPDRRREARRDFAAFSIELLKQVHDPTLRPDLIQDIVDRAEAGDSCAICGELLDKPDNDNGDGELLGHTLECPIASARELLDRAKKVADSYVDHEAMEAMRWLLQNEGDDGVQVYFSHEEGKYMLLHPDAHKDEDTSLGSLLIRAAEHAQRQKHPHHV